MQKDDGEPLLLERLCMCAHRSWPLGEEVQTNHELFIIDGVVLLCSYPGAQGLSSVWYVRACGNCPAAPSIHARDAADSGFSNIHRSFSRTQYGRARPNARLWRRGVGWWRAEVWNPTRLLSRLCNQTLGICRAWSHLLTHFKNTIVHQHAVVECTCSPVVCYTLMVIMAPDIYYSSRIPKSAWPDMSLFLLSCLSSPSYFSLTF